MEHYLRMIVLGLNSIVEEAVSDGGDAGGAYHSNKDDLRLAMETFLKVLNIDHWVEVVELKWPESKDYYSELQFRMKE